MNLKRVLALLTLLVLLCSGALAEDGFDEIVPEPADEIVAEAVEEVCGTDTADLDDIDAAAPDDFDGLEIDPEPVPEWTENVEIEPVSELTEDANDEPVPEWTGDIESIYEASALMSAVAAEALMPADTQTILALTGLTTAQTNQYLTAKPTEADLQKFPKQLQATVEGGTDPVNVDVNWVKDEDASNDNLYLYKPQVTGDGYTLSTTATIPSIKLHILTNDTFTFTINSGDPVSVTITGCTETGKAKETLDIPPVIMGVPVTAIKDEAFKDCTALTGITFPDSLTKIGDNLFAVDTTQEPAADKVTRLGLAVYHDTTLTAADSFAPTPAEGKQIGSSVKLSKPITDIEVKKSNAEAASGGTLTIDCDFTIEKEHSLSVNADCKAKVNTGKTVKNLGTITNSGTFTNDGTINSCGGTITGTIDGTAPVTTHSFSEGVCSVCGAYDNDIAYATIDAIADQVFTGAAITPGVTVTLHGTALTATTDYTVAYDKNVNVGTATITLTGAGSYKGTKEITFNITPKPITDVSGVTDVEYTGYDISHTIVVKSGDATLTGGSDFDVAYSGKINASADPHTVTVTGKGNYSGEIEKTFKITPIALSDSRVTVSDLTGSEVFTGNAITKTVKLTYNGKDLVEGTDYNVSYASNTDAGTATITITAAEPHGEYKIQNFTGSITRSFTITQRAITAEGIAVSGIENKTYSGSAQEQTNLAVTDGGRTLTKDTDYTVEYSNNTSQGTATVTIKGAGNYTGTRTESFTISPRAITAEDISVTGLETKTYTGSAQEQSNLVVTDGSRTLSKGSDYTLTYENNTNAGTAKITIDGKGNYTGAREVTFTINKAVRNTEVTYDGPKPTKVYDKTRNVTSSWNADSFFFSNVASGDTVRLNTASGKLKASYDAVDAGDRKVTIELAIVQSSKNYTYTLTNPKITVDGVITPKPLIIRPGVEKSSTDSTLVSQTKVFGAAEPSSYKAKVSGVMTGDSLAKSVKGKLSRETGENVGKYKITLGTIEGLGNYATAPNLEEGYFEITPKSINATDVGMVALGNQQYTGSAIEPAISLKYGTRTLVKGTDFDVKYANNKEAGVATVTITGKGNYNGTRTATFRILKVSSGSTNSIIYIDTDTDMDTDTETVSGPIQIPIVTNGKYVTSIGTQLQLNLGNLKPQRYQSTKKKIATVDANGLVTAKKAGKTKIVITLNKKTKIKLTLTVIDPTIPNKLTLNVPTRTVKKGDTITLQAVLPEGTSSGIKWTSSNKKVATVKGGVVKFKKKGTVTITATATRGKKKAKVKFKVGK